MIDVTLPQVQFEVGVIVERHRARSPWADFVWTPVAAQFAPVGPAGWMQLSDDGVVARFFCGVETVTLYRTESGHYRDNLLAASPSLWAALRPTASEPPYVVVAATVDPAEGESFTQAGQDLIGAVPLPEAARELIAAFVEAHPPRDVAYKRQRDDAGPPGAEATA